MTSGPKVLLIIPTHAHPATLPYAIQSALNQTHKNIEIVVIGDGVSNDTRGVMAGILSQHPEITFLDKPKAIRHGEEYRDEVIRKSDASLISYLGDDDLLFPNHLEVMVEHVQGVDFANPLPVFIEPDGSIKYLATDLSRADSLAWHLLENPIRNSVSLTGVIHTKDSYLRLPFGWRAAPPGTPTDLYMWHQYFQLPGFKAKTAQFSTTAKFANDIRMGMTDSDREEEISTFTEFLKYPDFQTNWNLKIQAQIHQTAVSTQLLVEANDIEIKSLNQTLAQVYVSKSWRITAPIRKMLNFWIR